jgi:hypothetical protein
MINLENESQAMSFLNKLIDQLEQYSEDDLILMRDAVDGVIENQLYYQKAINLLDVLFEALELND